MIFDLIEAEGAPLDRRSREVHDVRTFETRDVKQWLDDAGFSVEIADRYGAYALAPRRRAFFAILHGR